MLAVLLLGAAAACSSHDQVSGGSCTVASVPDAGDFYEAGICRGGIPCCPEASPDCASGGPYPPCVQNGTTTYTCGCCGDQGWGCWATGP